MDIVICEDIKDNADKLEKFLQKYFEDKDNTVNISVYENGDSFLADFANDKHKDLKIVFLDIYMPGTIGIDVAKKIREHNKDLIIVFTTTSESHGMDSYHVRALQYLLKPLDYSELEKVLDECMVLLTDSLLSIEVVSYGSKTKVYLKDIIYIEILNDELQIHTIFQTLKCPLSSFEFEKQAEDSIFLRTHDNYIINKRFIEDMDDNDFILINGLKIPINKDQKEEIKQRYRDYLTALSENM